MRFVLCLLFVIGTLGCKKGGYDQSQMAKLTAPEQKLVGKYKLETDFSNESKELVDLIKALELFETGETLLECFPDKTYVMMVGQVPVKGQWSFKDHAIQLRIEKVGDMRPEQIAKIENKNIGLSGWSMSRKQREEFLQAYSGAMALERAESMVNMRVGTDGTLYSVGAPKASLFGALTSYFKPLPKQ